MKKIINPIYRAFFVLFSSVLLSACADWKSRPVTVDENFGNSVRHVVEVQTLNPGSAYADQPVLGIDGQKSEGIINSYRAGTGDLTSGKKTVEFQVDE